MGWTFWSTAGIAGPKGNIEELDADAREQTVSTNLNSQYYFLSKAISFLKQSRQNPHIIAMSSVAGRLGYPFRTPYASTKWAISRADEVVGGRTGATQYPR
ncbi:SDR family NAD(P)-dependent oxidoreductase [Pseudomonas sp. G.S.17]|uniref:SDR family NAD(P)-dependent oxidoreductase n=1 Tax=Pseudomonas sp. G.S.17 TaxID=3137451 RepID=UPI00311CDD4D